MKRIKRLFTLVMILSLGYVAGYGTSYYGPPLDALLAQVGIELPPRAPYERSRTPTPEEVVRPVSNGELDAYDVRARIGDYARRVNTRIEELEAKRKEKQTAINLYRTRGESDSSEVISRLRGEQERIDESLLALVDARDEAIEVQSGLQRVIDATEEVDAGYVDDDESLLDARAVLARMEALGLR